jgi:hypothetical protein
LFSQEFSIVTCKLSSLSHMISYLKGLADLRRKDSLVQYSTSMTKRFGHRTCKFGHGTLFYDQLMTKLNWSQKLRHIWSTMTNLSFWS